MCALLAWRDFGLSSQRDALLTTFCLLAPLAFLPQGRALRQKAQKFAGIFTFQKNFCYFLGVFLGFGHAPKASRGTFWAFSRVRKACLARFWTFRACALLAWRVFDFLALAHCFPGAFLGFSRVRTASPTRFRGKCVCARLPSQGRVLRHSAMRCLPTFVARLCLAYRLFVCSQCSQFCVAAQCAAYIAAHCAAYRVFLRKTRAVLAKNTKIRAYSVRFHPSKAVWCGFFGKKWAFKEQLKFASKCERKL